LFYELFLRIKIRELLLSGLKQALRANHEPLVIPFRKGRAEPFCFSLRTEI
jgi:hypothetical protein